MKIRVIISLFSLIVSMTYGSAITGKVIDILSGDVIKVSTPSGNRILRLNHIDAPEYGQPYYQNSIRCLSKLIYKKKVLVYIEDEDLLNTPLVTIIFNTKNINKEMVAEGYAWWYSFYSTDLAYLDLERNAKKEKIGLWCHHEQPLEPWIYRERRRAKVNNDSI